MHEYFTYALDLPEREFLKLFRDRWPQTKMLDIGIGTGRTTFTFAALAGEYVGIDYAAQMLERSREVLPEHENVTYDQCDARDLSRFYDKHFDFVLFSHNGIDSVGHDDRVSILNEVKKVLAPTGFFCFSSHSIASFTLAKPLPSLNLKSPIRWAYQLAKQSVFNVRKRYTYRGTPISEIHARDWSLLKTGDHDFNIDIYHVRPTFQIQQLNAMGFSVERVIDTRGNDINPEDSPSDWLYYVCTHSEQHEAA